MLRTHVLNDSDLTRAFQKAKLGDKFFIRDADERKRVYRCATCAGRQVATRKTNDGFNATVI